MTSLIRRLALAGIMSILVLGAVGTTFAQTATPPPAPPPACVADAQTACVKIVFYPATLKGDLFLGSDPATAQPTPQVQQSALYVTFPTPAAGQTIPVLVKNIHDGGPGEGTLYQFPDMPKTVTVPSAAGQTTTVTLSPVKTYIRGKITAKCAPQSVLAGEDVSCIVSLDGAPQTIPAPVPTPNPDGSLPPQAPPAATLAAGQTVTFIVDPGKHDVKFDLTGANAALWAPASQTKTVTVTAGTVAQIATATFVKAGHLVATLDKAADGWVGDFYLDGTLVKPQVGSIDVWVEGNKSHTIEVKNINHPQLWPLIHLFADSTATTYVAAAGSVNVTVKLATIPASQVAFPMWDNASHTATSDKYIALKVSWLSLTKDQAEFAFQHTTLHVLFNGQNLGEIALFRTPVSQVTNGYSFQWLLPLGKLAPGTYTQQAFWTFDQVVFDGLDTYQIGTYYGKPATFTIVAPAGQ